MFTKFNLTDRLLFVAAMASCSSLAFLWLIKHWFSAENLGVIFLGLTQLGVILRPTVPTITANKIVTLDFKLNYGGRDKKTKI